MTVAEKPTIPHSEALKIAREARDIAFGSLARILGHPIDVGQFDGDGIPFTTVRIRTLRGSITRAGIRALRDAYRIIPNGK